MREVTREEIANGVHSGNLIITTRNESKYQFEVWKYNVIADTIYGEGIRETKNEGERKFIGKVALNDIISGHVEFYDAGTTSLLVLGIIGLVLLAVLAISVRHMNFNN